MRQYPLLVTLLRSRACDSLRRRVTYKVVSSAGADDLAGNLLDEDAARSGSRQHEWFFTVNE